MQIPMQPPTFGKAQPRKKLSLVDPNTGKPIDLGGRESSDIHIAAEDPPVVCSHRSLHESCSGDAPISVSEKE